MTIANPEAFGFQKRMQGSSFFGGGHNCLENAKPISLTKRSNFGGGSESVMQVECDICGKRKTFSIKEATN